MQIEEEEEVCLSQSSVSLSIIFLSFVWMSYKHTLSLISHSLSWLEPHCAAALSSFQLCARFFRDFSPLFFECLMLSSVHDLVRKSDCSFNCDMINIQHRMKLLLRYQGWSPIETMSKNCVHTCTFLVDSELNLVQNKSVILAFILH